MTVKYSELSKEAKQRRNRQNAASRARYEKAAYKKYSLRIRVDGGDGFTPEQLEANYLQLVKAEKDRQMQQK